MRTIICPDCLEIIKWGKRYNSRTHRTEEIGKCGCSKDKTVLCKKCKRPITVAYNGLCEVCYYAHKNAIPLEI